MGKGNNSVLVKTIIKHRPWWSIVGPDAEANLQWTQGRSKKFMDKMSMGQRIKSFEWEKSKTIKMTMLSNNDQLMS